MVFTAKKLCFMCLLLATLVNSQFRYSSWDVIQNNNLLRPVGMTEKTCPNNICEHVWDYPRRSVERLIKKQNRVQSYFGNVIKPSNRSTFIRTRMNEDLNNRLCNTIDRTRRPQFMLDVENNPRIIANVPNYKQVVNFQLCAKQTDKCSTHRILHRKTRCVQKFHVIKLLTLDKKRNVLEYHPFELPSTCVCTYEITS